MEAEEPALAITSDEKMTVMTLAISPRVNSHIPCAEEGSCEDE